MRVIRQTLAAVGIAALVVPAAALSVAASSGADETVPGAVVTAWSQPAQTLVAAGAEASPLDRGGYVVEVVAPPPPPPPVVPEPQTASAGTSFAAAPQSYSGANVVAYAEEFVGKVMYGPGNHPDDSFSCDGYVQYVFAAFGISLPRGANQQAARGYEISPSEGRAGDLLWWPDTHIAIYDGNGGMLHSVEPGRAVTHRPDLWGDPAFIRLP